MEETNEVSEVPVPVVPPVYSDAQQVKILKIQRRALSLKNAIIEVAQQHASLIKQHEQTMLDLDVAVKEVVDAANYDMTGQAFNLETLVIEPANKPADKK